jgi:hypothetical protein
MARPFASVPGPNGSMSAPASTLRDLLPRRQLTPVHQIAENSLGFFECAPDAMVAADQEGCNLELNAEAGR